MKYSLRSLMIVVTLVCFVLGGRIEYLRRMAAFHEREATDYIESIENAADRGDMEWVKDNLISRRSRVGEGDMKGRSRGEIFIRHCVLVGIYRRAVYRPCKLIDETKPPEYHP